MSANIINAVKKVFDGIVSFRPKRCSMAGLETRSGKTLCVRQKSTMCVTKRRKQNGDKIGEKGAGARELSV